MVKVLVIGLDGATWDLIKPWTKEGSLPTFKRLMEEGSWGNLKSTIPPISPPAWTSISTGKNPGKHAIFDFLGMKGDYSRYPNLSINKRSAEIWDFINGSIVAHVPLTYPPKKIKGIMISGMLTPSLESEFTYPRGLREEIVEKFPNYQIELNWRDYFGRKEQLIKDIYGQLKEKINLFWFLFHKEWNFMFFVFPEIDRIQHVIFGEQKLLDYYSLIDDFLQGVLREIEDKDVVLILISDHGFERVYKTVHINTYFENEGLIRLKTLNKLVRKIGATKESPVAAFFYFKFMKIYKKLFAKSSRMLKKSITKSQYFKFEVESKAFMRGFGRIYINHKSRFVKGCVEDAAYAKTREEIIEKLEDLKDPETGRNVIKNVYKSEEIYSGRFSNEGPDLVALMESGYTPSPALGGKVIRRQKLRKGDHNLNGIFLAYGSAIKTHHEINATIYDVAPTILHTMGIPVPEDMDGRVLKEIFEEDSEPVRRKIVYQKAKPKPRAETEKIKRRAELLKKSGKI